MDLERRKQWSKCIITGAMQIEDSITDDNICWNIDVIQMALNRIKEELKQAETQL
ncbi:MAG TPA: hypothetical protein VIK78_14600 [Ruminiclostridium sp.]